MSAAWMKPDEGRHILTRETAIKIVCETAFAWCAEYGFTDPDTAYAVWDAAKLLAPELEPKRS